MGKPKVDLTGQKFGEWSVIEYAGNHFWKCECSCGVIKNIQSYSLKTGGSKSCGHNPRSSKLEDLTGKQFGEWTPLQYAGDSKWKCRCSCGEIKVVAAYDLKKGKSRNCGHNRKKPYRDLTGQRFGEMTVIKYLYKNRYLCKCSCGTEREVMGTNLLSGSTVSCGCKHMSPYTEEFMRSVISRYIEENNEKPFIADISRELNITHYYANQLINKYNLKGLVNTSFGSKYEKEIYDVIIEADSNIEVLTRNRSVLAENKELDLYIPSKRLAIEFNGDYWHSYEKKGSKYHQQKTLECAKAGIQLIHIFEHEWLDEDKKIKIINLLKNKIDNSKLIRIYARNCIVKQVDKAEEREFINKYHIQNYTESRVAYGLYFKDKLVSIMTFGIPRFGNTSEWELIRYCTSSNVAIVGGHDKIFKHFIKCHNPKSIVSYCDISKFKGSVYTKLGFNSTISDLTSPNYKWIKQDYNNISVLTRYQTQKQRLLDMGYGIYGDTEDEIMTNMGYIKVYDSGNLRLHWYST